MVEPVTPILSAAIHTHNVADLARLADGDRVALVWRAEEITFGSLRRAAASIASGLLQNGVEPGDRVAVAAASNPSFVASVIALWSIGAVVVPLNPSSPPMEMQAELAACKARALILGPSAVRSYSKVDPLEIELEMVFGLGGANHGSSIALLESGQDQFVSASRSLDDPALVIFTSGTAGASRPAVLSHGNLLANLDQSASIAAPLVGENDVVFCALPLFHAFGLTTTLLLAIAQGAKLLLFERFDPDSALAAIRDQRATFLPGAPAMFGALAAHPTASPADLVSLKAAMSGAAPLTDDIALAFQERFSISLSQGYGLTEASPGVTIGIGAEVPPGSVGKLLPGIEIRFVEEDGQEALDGDPGEILLRGPNIFMGYLDDEAATRKVLDEQGWLHTGDVGVMDDDGWLYLVGREKDLIIVSGFNVSPSEVEEVIDRMPQVSECAVVGVPHPHTGEAVKALVVLGEGGFLDEDEVISFCQTHMARYKCPSIVEFVSALDKTALGKIRRSALV